MPSRLLIVKSIEGEGGITIGEKFGEICKSCLHRYDKYYIDVQSGYPTDN